jgi:AcrR family transcriptional regulator
MAVKEREDDFRERARAKLLASAQAVIASEGHTAVQARRVATDAGCAVGTVYNIYRDIDGLILAANGVTLKDLRAALEAAQRRAIGQNLQSRLMTLAVAYLDFATVNRSRWRAVFEHRVPDDYPVPPEYLDDRRGLLALIENELVEAVPDPSARQDAARALFSATHGNVLLSLDAKLGAFEPDRCERQIGFIVRHVVAGLQAPDVRADGLKNR